MGRIRRNLERRLTRWKNARRKLFWLVSNGASRSTSPVFIVGTQRSGTGMLGECLDKSPEFENLGESDPRAFDKYFVKDDQTIGQLIRECKYPFIVFKPLKDSHRWDHLLSLHPGAKAIWAYRNYLDRINSAVKKFGRHPLDVFEAFAKGSREDWQLLGSSPKVARVVMSFNVSELSESDGAALMWWVRNALFFDLKLDKDPRVRLWSYDAFVRGPEADLREMLQFLGGRFHSYMLADVHGRSFGKDPAPALRADVRQMCQGLFDRLERVRTGKENGASAGTGDFLDAEREP